MSDFFFVGSGPGVGVTHKESGGYSAGEISLVAGQSHDLSEGGGTSGMM